MPKPRATLSPSTVNELQTYHQSLRRVDPLAAKRVKCVLDYFSDMRGETQAKIASHNGVSLRSLAYWIRRYQTGRFSNRESWRIQQGRRLTALSSEQLEQLVHFVRKNPSLGAVRIHTRATASWGWNVKIDCIRYWLRKIRKSPAIT